MVAHSYNANSWQTEMGCSQASSMPIQSTQRFRLVRGFDWDRQFLFVFRLYRVISLTHLHCSSSLLDPESTGMHPVTASFLDPFVNLLNPVDQTLAFAWHHLSEGFELMSDSFLSENLVSPSFYPALLVFLPSSSWSLCWYVFQGPTPSPSTLSQWHRLFPGLICLL